MENLIILAILIVIVGLAARYVYKSKKAGVKCIGCPDGCSCPYKKSGKGCSGCSDAKTKEC